MMFVRVPVPPLVALVTAFSTVLSVPASWANHSRMSSLGAVGCFMPQFFQKHNLIISFFSLLKLKKKQQNWFDKISFLLLPLSPFVK